MEFTEILHHVDHTVLAAVSTWDQVDALCKQALEHKMASVCIPPSFVKQAKDAFGDGLNVCTVIGFPLGYNTTATKLFETQDALANGAGEIDMVVNLGWVKQGLFDEVTQEIQTLKKACGDKVLKVIIETCYLTQEEKIQLCRCVTQGGADFIKTSTGFGTAGAQLEDIRLFKEHIGPAVKIKASGGIRTREDYQAFMELGCERLGTSSAMKVLGE